MRKKEWMRGEEEGKGKLGARGASACAARAIDPIMTDRRMHRRCRSTEKDCARDTSLVVCQHNGLRRLDVSFPPFRLSAFSRRN